MRETAHGLVLLVCITLFWIALYTAAQQRDSLKAEAVKRGFAQWVVDDSGTKTFQWKEGAK
jgi:hypothetical protein